MGFGKKQFTSILISLFLGSSVHLQAQSQPQTGDDHNQLITPLWEMIAFSNYKHTYNDSKKWVPVFKPDLKAFNKKTVTLPGYIIAVKAGMMHDLFMLSVLPVAQCAFCGAGNVPAMVEIHMKSAIEFTDKPVKIRGKLFLNNSGDMRSEFYLLEAELVKD